MRVLRGGLQEEVPAPEAPAEASSTKAADARILRAVLKYAVESHDVGFETSMGRMEPIPPPDSGPAISGLESDPFR